MLLYWALLTSKKIFLISFDFFLPRENTDSRSSEAFIMFENCNERNRFLCQTSLVTLESQSVSQSVTDWSRVAALLPSGPGGGKNKMSISLRRHYVRDGCSSDKSALYHGADARRQTRTFTLTRTDNSESINLSWLSWGSGSLPDRRSEARRKSWKGTLELLNI